MRTLHLIGIGPGHPAQLTLEAIAALARTDVVFILDKGEATQDLAYARKQLCDHHIPHPYRIVEAQDPVRDESIPDYATRVQHWHTQRVELYETLLNEQLTEAQTGAILIWGDPSLYDSTLRIVDQLQQRARIPFIYNVIPGVTSLQSLAAAHRIPLHGIGESILITPARKLSDASFDRAENVVVMLDGEQAFTRLTLSNLHIWWGAYVGMAQQLLIAGRLPDVAQSILETRSRAREEHGWIMDIYLIRRA